MPTFDMRGAAADVYALRGTDSATEATLNAALTVIAGRGASIAAAVTGPATVRPNRAYGAQIDYGNAGGADAVAPLLVLRCPSGTPVGRTPEGLFVRDLIMLGAGDGAQAGVLRPGERHSIPIFFKVNSAAVNFTITAIEATDSRPLDWEIVQRDARPEGTDDALWQRIWPVIRADIGSTWGDLVRMLARNASLVPPELGPAGDVQLLYRLEVMKATAATGTSISGHATTTDLAVDLSGREVTARNLTSGDVYSTLSLTDGSFIFESVTPGTI